MLKSSSGPETTALANPLVPLPRRAFADLSLWEQRLVGTAKKWEGWSVVQHGERIQIKIRRGGKAVPQPWVVPKKKTARINRGIAACYQKHEL